MSRDTTYPPSGPVEWEVTYDGSTTTVVAASWYAARALGAQALGAPREAVDPRQVVRVVTNGVARG